MCLYDSYLSGGCQFQVSESIAFRYLGVVMSACDYGVRNSFNMRIRGTDRQKNQLSCIMTSAIFLDGFGQMGNLALRLAALAFARSVHGRLAQHDEQN